jgi:hypothetical protein
MKVCKWCGSEFVCWNWFKSPFWRTYLRNFYRGWKRPWRYLDRWSHECWNCSNMISTFFKVRDGILHNDLEKKFVHLPKHTVHEAFEEASWIIDQSNHFSEKEKHKFDRRVKMALGMLAEAFEEQWKLDGPKRPVYDEETEKKYENHFHSASILKLLD